MASRYRFSAQILGRIGVCQGGRVNDALGAKRFARVWGQADLTRRHRSALVAGLACANLLAVTLAVEAAATRGGAKGSPAATAQSAGKTAKATGKKVAT